MARPRIPSKIHEIKGSKRTNHRLKHDRAGEPVPTGPVGGAPKHLTDEQAAVWDELVSITPPGVLTCADAPHLEVVACLLAEFRAAPADFPAARLAILNRSLAQCGLTPSDRSKVCVAPADKGEVDDPWSQFS